jgi:serine protease Do
LIHGDAKSFVLVQKIFEPYFHATIRRTMQQSDSTTNCSAFPGMNVWIGFNFLELDFPECVLRFGKIGIFRWEDDMSYLAKYRVVALMVILAGIQAIPLGYAQGDSFSRIFQVNSSGSYLGITMDDVTAANMSKYKLSVERGVIVRSVSKGSPAEAANLREDDVILDYGGYPVWSSAQFRRLVEDTPAGRKVDLVVSRDGKRMNLSAKIENREGKRTENQFETPIPRGLFSQNPRSFQFQLPNGPDSSSSEELSSHKPRLGVTLQPLTEQLGEYMGVPGKNGALVASVSDGSASAGKIKTGDVIIGANSKTIGSPEDLTQFIRSAEGTITLKIIRDKKEITVIVNLPADENQKGYKL